MAEHHVTRLRSACPTPLRPTAWPPRWRSWRWGHVQAAAVFAFLLVAVEVVRGIGVWKGKFAFFWTFFFQFHYPRQAKVPGVGDVADDSVMFFGRPAWKSLYTWRLCQMNVAVGWLVKPIAGCRMKEAEQYFQGVQKSHSWRVDHFVSRSGTATCTERTGSRPKRASKGSNGRMNDVNWLGCVVRTRMQSRLWLCYVAWSCKKPKSD